MAINYVPIDEWAEDLHPVLTKNIDSAIEMMADLDEPYHLRRAIMQFIRQEFEP
jgi:hypothetical protein